MDASQAHPLQAVIHAWLHERHQALLEQVMMTWEEGMGRLNPDADLLAKLEAAAAPKPDPARDLDPAMDLLEGAATQGEVLQKLLEALRPFGDRGALFILKQGLATLFAHRGFEAERPKNGVTVVPPPELEALLQGRAPSLRRPGEAYAALLDPLSKSSAADLAILPLRLKRKAVAVLLVDSGNHPKLEHMGAIRAIAHSAESCLSHLAGAKEEESRTGTMPIEVPPSLQTQRVPEPVQTAAPPPPAELDPKIRATAERLARVLVGDIELYFPQKVSNGRLAGNLYAPLREELERSRATFIDRFGQDVEVRHRIFYRTLVDLLCEGDAGKLKGAPWAP